MFVVLIGFNLGSGGRREEEYLGRESLGLVNKNII